MKLWMKKAIAASAPSIITATRKSAPAAALSIAAENGFTVDTENFHKLLDEQRERSREAWRGSGEEAQAEVYKNLNAKFGVTDFVGHEEFAEPVTVKVQAIVTNGDTVPEVYAGDEATILLDPTPFYGESGGQIGDTGCLTGHHDDSDIKVRARRCTRPI